MSEIEKAIEYLNDKNKFMSFDFSNGKDLTAILLSGEQAELAIQALKEKAERDKGCWYCNSKYVLIGDGIKYCINCGRKLGK